MRNQVITRINETFMLTIQKLKRKMTAFFWNNHRHRLLSLRGLNNHAIRLDDEFLDLFIQIYAQDRALMSIREMHNLYTLVQKVKKISGDLAEVGVYKGGSARIICEVKGQKNAPSL